MTKKPNPPSNTDEPPGSSIDELRRRAEQDPRSSAIVTPELKSASEIAQLIHELQVHQVELEMQNEELRTTQAQLQRSQAQYFELYELAPVGYLTLNDKGLIIASNLTAAKLLGVTKNALAQRAFSQFVAPEHQDTYYHCFRKLQTKGHLHPCELNLLRADETKFWATMEASLAKDEAGGKTQVRCIISDISRRKKAEQEQLETEERLVLAMNASGENLWDWDIQHDKVIHNHKWFEMLGLNENSLDHSVGFFTTLLHPDDRETVLLRLRQAVEGNGRFHSEHRLRRADGVYLWVLEKGIVVARNETGKALRMVGIFVDISERKQTEHQQRELQNHYERLLKLQVVNRTVAAIAHDLNQPLSAAASYTDALQNILRNPNNTTAKVKYTLDQVAEQIKRAGKVVHDLLKFLHNGETIAEPVDLNQMAHQVIETLKDDVYIRGLRIALELASDLPKVSANTLQLEMVLTNLIRNAIEAMETVKTDDPASGTILIIVRTADSGSHAHLSVRDTGPGVPEDQRQKIFEAFFSTKSHGLGMGLSISRALIEAQGGQLWCQPNIGPGATFHLTLPFATEATL